MRKISVQSLEENMILAKDVNDKNGRILLGKGANLTLKIIQKFNDLEIDAIFVEGDPETDEEKERSFIGYGSKGESMDEILETIQHKFEHVRQDPILAEIEKIIMHRVQK